MTTEEIMERLAAPFEADEIKFKPQVVSGSRAMCITYVDARVVMDRLDEVFGVGGWQTGYQVIQDGVVCKLRVRVGPDWVEHQDVGSFSEQPDDGDKLKAAFSDSLKRVAVHLGVGRYLYRLPQTWCDYDPAKKKILKPPQLPAWALPKPAAPEAKPAPPPAVNGTHPKPSSSPQKVEAQPNALPKTGEELTRRLNAFQAQLIEKGLCKSGELRSYVDQHAKDASFPADILTWKEAHIKTAVGWARTFEADAKKPKAETAASTFANLLAASDEQMAKEGLCRPGDLVAHIKAEAHKRFMPDDFARWSEKDLALGQSLAVRFRDARRAQRGVGQTPGRDMDAEADAAMATDHFDPYDDTAA